MDMRSGAYMTMEELIHSAIDFESDSAKFYSDMIAAANWSVDVKALLGQLRDEELKHEASLKGLRISESEARVQFPPDFNLGPFPTLPAASDFDSMLDIATDRELKSVEMYKNASVLVSGGIARLLSDLSRFEEIHVRMLKEMKNR